MVLRRAQPGGAGLDDGLRSGVDGGQAAPVRQPLHARRRRQARWRRQSVPDLLEQGTHGSNGWWWAQATVAPAAGRAIDLPQGSALASLPPELTHNGYSSNVDEARHEQRHA